MHDNYLLMGSDYKLKIVNVFSNPKNVIAYSIKKQKTIFNEIKKAHWS